VVDAQLGALIVDFDSANGTYINKKRIPPYSFQAIPSADTEVAFGASSRSYFFSVDTQADLKRKALLCSKLSDPSASVLSETSENTVFVRNVSLDVTDKDIKEFFAPCGAITQVSVPRDRGSGQTKGIAFISFASLSGVLQAVARDGDEFMGKYLKVKRSEAKKAHSQHPHTVENKQNQVEKVNKFENRTINKDFVRNDNNFKKLSQHSNEKTRETTAEALINKKEKEVEYDYDYYKSLYGLEENNISKEEDTLTRESSSTELISSKRQATTEVDESPPRRLQAVRRGIEKNDDESPPRRRTERAKDEIDESPPRRKKRE
jgi:RNA recognition motif-containing protein